MLLHPMHYRLPNMQPALGSFYRSMSVCPIRYKALINHVIAFECLFRLIRKVYLDKVCCREPPTAYSVPMGRFKPTNT